MAAVLVLNTPDNGRLRPKHVEWLCRNKTCTVLHQDGVSFDGLWSPEDGHNDARNMLRQKLIINNWLLQPINFNILLPSTHRLPKLPLFRRISLYEIAIRVKGTFPSDLISSDVVTVLTVLEPSIYPPLIACILRPNIPLKLKWRRHFFDTSLLCSR